MEEEDETEPIAGKMLQMQSDIKKKLVAGKPLQLVINAICIISMYAARGSLIPFLPIYFYELQFTGLQAGILFGAKSLFTLIMKPIWVSATRKISSGKMLTVVLLSGIGLSVVFKLGLNIIPGLLQEPPDPHCVTPSNVTTPKRTVSRREVSILASNYTTQTIATIISNNNEYNSNINTERSNKDTAKHIVSPNRKTEHSPIEQVNANQDWKDSAKVTITKAVDMQKESQKHYRVEHKGKVMDGIMLLQSIVPRTEKSIADMLSEHLFLAIFALIAAECIFAAPVENITQDFLQHHMEEDGKKAIIGRMQVMSSMAMAVAALGISILLSFIGCAVYLDVSFVYHSHYNLMLVAYLTFSAISFFTAPSIPFSKEITKINIIQAAKAFKYDKSNRLVMYLLSVFMLGLSQPAAYIFLLWKLQRINGADWVIGGMVMMSAISETFMLLFAKVWIRNIRISRLVGACIFFQGLRFLYYPFVTLPWTVIPSEILYMFTSTLLWMSLYNYIEHIAPPLKEQEAYFVLQTFFWEAGCAVGTIVCGETYDLVGDDILFIGVSVVIFIWLLVFALVVNFGCVRATNKEDEESKEQDLISKRKQRHTSLAPWMNEPKISTSVNFEISEASSQDEDENENKNMHVLGVLTDESMDTTQDVSSRQSDTATPLKADMAAVAQSPSKTKMASVSQQLLEPKKSKSSKWGRVLAQNSFKRSISQNNLALQSHGKKEKS